MFVRLEKRGQYWECRNSYLIIVFRIRGSYTSFLYLFSVCVCKHCMSGGQRTICGSLFYPSTTWIPEIKFRLSLDGKHLYSLSHLTGPSFFFSSLYLIPLNSFPVWRARFSSVQYYIINTPYRPIAGSGLEQTETRNNCWLSGLLLVLWPWASLLIWVSVLSVQRDHIYSNSLLWE